MKKAPALRFKGFTNDWEQRKLGDVLSKFDYGLNSASSDYDGKNKYLRITDIDEQTHRFNLDNLTSPKVDLKNKDNYILHPGDIVFARTGASVGKTYKYREDDGRVYFAGFLIRGRINKNFDTSFIFDTTLLPKYSNFVKITSIRSGQPGINSDEYKKYVINIPTINEQKYISKLITNLEELITLQQRKLKLLKLMKNIVSYNLVVSHKLASNNEIKWKAVYLKDIARIYQPTTITKKDLLPKGIPVFGANDYIGFYNKYNHETDQVTICARGASAGHPNYVKGPVWITGNSMVINVDETYINKKFLYTLLTFTDLKRFVTGGAQPQITRENLNSLKILLPSIKAQNNLSAIIENLSINIRKVQLSINSAKRLKQFLLQNMFI